MITIKNFAFPKSLEEAYRVLNEKRNNVILGGCAFLRMTSKRIETAIDLSKLDLSHINENDETIEIGSMTTFREIETNPILNKYFNGVLPKSVENIVGVQLRNIVTVGGTVHSKYGFSDFITALLSLNAEVTLYKQGTVHLKEYLEQDTKKDIVISISIPKTNRKAAFQMMRNSRSDYAILNVAVSNEDNDWNIVVGARPQRAKIAKEASKYISQSDKSIEEVEKAALMASEELDFGDNMRASKEYREEICKVLVKRAIMEVL
ncbi:FAD binding domain-containing protein [Haloimpatiens sp. FM7330]|uniref:FAD binding domain-containing protein n=1 Tax=Haloimpatiens sp. FM7330 TaxID=3298610 RepID=UPI003632D662